MNDNVRPFGVVSGGGGNNATTQEETLPVNRYIVEDIDGTTFPAEGFLVFTSAHVAVMRETEKGAIPVLVVPLDRVKCAELFEEDDAEDELLF